MVLQILTAAVQVKIASTATCSCYCHYCYYYFGKWAGVMGVIAAVDVYAIPP
jgi:hypothetical protein